MFENYAPFKYQNQVFYPTDICNCIQGLLIFMLFVVKHRVYQALRKRLGLDEKEKFGYRTTLQDPFKMRKSVSNSTLTSTFAVSSIPWSRSFKFYFNKFKSIQREIYIYYIFLYILLFFPHRATIHFLHSYDMVIFISWMYRIAEIEIELYVYILNVYVNYCYLRIGRKRKPKRNKLKKMEIFK